MSSPQSPQEPRSGQEDAQVDPWVALAKWNLGEWSDERYADYVEATGDGGVSDEILIKLLRNRK